LRLAKTTEYAIRVLYQMATGEHEISSVYRLHRQLQLPYKYLGRLMRRLADARLVEPIQGKQGGYRLARPDNRIYLYEIIGAVEGLDNYQRCILGLAECSGENPCALHEHWVKIREKMQELVYNMSLGELKEKGTKRHKGTKRQRKQESFPSDDGIKGKKVKGLPPA